MRKVPFIVFRALLYCISILPFSIIYLLSDMLYIFFYYVFRYRKKVVYENLTKSFPDKSENEIKIVARNFYKFLCDQVLESVKMLTISEKTVRERFRINNIDEIQQHLKNQRSIIAVTGHYGNFEWGILILSIHIKTPVLIVYKPINDKRFENMVNKMRAKFNAILVPMRSTLRKMSEYQKESYVAVLVSDQTPAKSEIGYYTQFLNQNTPVFLGVEKLAKLTNNPVVYCHIDRPKRGYYECTFETLFEEPQLQPEKDITECHIRRLEQIIRKKPELWLWSHRRWKYSV